MSLYHGYVALAITIGKLSLHERCLQIIYQDKQSSFEQLLKKDNSVSIHQTILFLLVLLPLKCTK